VVLEAKKASQCALAFLREADKKEREERKIISGTNIGYTVPNLVDYNNLEDSFEVYFRTAKKAERAKIVIKQDDKVIKEVKKRYVQPAEMNKVILKAEELIKNREITILMEVL
jgi:sarcosine oxidase subunit alpha